MPTESSKKTTIMKQFQQHPSDTGSAPVQIALLTERINGLTDHFKLHRKDVHSRQGLLKMVSRRRRLLDYVKRQDEDAYRQLLESLSLRK